MTAVGRCSAQGSTGAAAAGLRDRGQRTGDRGRRAEDVVLSTRVTMENETQRLREDVTGALVAAVGLEVTRLE